MKSIVKYCLPALSVLILSASTCFAADSPSQGQGLIEKLENQFFEHTYPSDNDEKRVERLEKLIFGESKSGDLQKRIQTLSASLPKNTDASQLTDQGSGVNQSPQIASSNQKNTSQTQSQPQDQGQDNDDPSTDYPRVDAAEHLLLGKTFQNEPLSRRLDQLEVKAFGKPTGNPDLSDRVDRLDDYIQSHYHQSIAELTDPRKQLHYNSNDDLHEGPISLNQNSQFQQNVAMNAPSVNAPLEVQVAWMEEHVFGQSLQNSHLSLLDRVKRLEGQVFPGEATDSQASLPMQIKVLMNAVELSSPAPALNIAAQPQYQQPYGQPSYNAPSYQNMNRSQPQYNQQLAMQQQQQPLEQQQEQMAQNQNKGHPFLKSLAKTLMTVGSMAASSMSYGGMYGNSGYGGMGYNGMGYGGMPLNMGGGGPPGYLW